HFFPKTLEMLGWDRGGTAATTKPEGNGRLRRPASRVAPRGEGQDGSLRVPSHTAPGRQGPGLGAVVLSRGAGPRRLRRSLLLSVARPAGAGRRRQCAARGDRGADGE